MHAVASAILVICVTLTVYALLPAAFGWRTSVIVSGSMAPLIRAGDIVAFQPVDPERLRPGDVILAADPARPGQLLTHRVAAVRADLSLVTRGDANPDVDATPVPPDAVLGRARLLIPAVGRLALLGTPYRADALRWYGLLLGALAAWWLTAPRRYGNGRTT